MAALTSRIASGPADMALLSFALVLWLFGLLAIWRLPVPAGVAYLALVELFFFAWAAAVSKEGRVSGMRFALQTQLILAVRITATTALALASVGSIFFLLNLVNPDPKLAAVPANPNARLALARLCAILVLGMPFVSFWYLHALKLRRLSFPELARGQYLENTLLVSGPAVRVQQGLDFYLRALASDLSVPLNTVMYGVRPTLSSVAGADGKALYECVWTWLPVKLLIEVQPDGAQATTIITRCLLRGGWYRLEAGILANEALLVLEHLQLHVMQPLRNDMAQREAERRQEALRVQSMEMRLKVLQAQVEPHFLFNTMANLRHLYRTDVIAGENMLNHLISYLRGAMDGLRSEQSSVGAELALARHYLALMKVRMGSRLSYSVMSFDDIDTLAFPPAMLISLVENAIKHGLQDKPAGQLRITAAREDDKLKISVIDNGPGFGSIAGTGVGLSNIRQRLEAMHGNAAWLEAGALADGGFVSTIVVPL